MPTTYRATYRSSLVASAPCESCGQHYWVTKPLQAVGSAYNLQSAQSLAMKSLTQKMDNIQAKRLYHFQKCPNCGYVQSWMQPSLELTKLTRTRYITYGLLWLGAIAVTFGLFNVFDRVNNATAPSVILAVALIATPILSAVAMRQFLTQKYRNPETVLLTFAPFVSFGASPHIAHTTVGSHYLNLKKYDVARTHFNEALRQNASDASAYAGLGFCAMAEDNLNEAMTCFKKHVSLAHQDASPTVLAFLSALENPAPTSAQNTNQDASPAS